MAKEEKKVNMDLNKLSDAMESVSDVKDAVTEGVKEVTSTDEGKAEVTIPKVPAKISGKTITTIIATVIVMVNTMSALFGENFGWEIDDNLLYQIGTFASIVINVGYALWYNHDITKKARQRTAIADQVLPKKDEVTKG